MIKVKAKNKSEKMYAETANNRADKFKQRDYAVKTNKSGAISH